MNFRRLKQTEFFLKIYRCLEEGAEDFIVKPVKLSDVKRLKGYMTTREVKVGSHDRGSGVEINNKRKLEEEEETSDMSSSPPSMSTLSSSPFLSSPSSSPTSSPTVLASPIRRLKMSTIDWLSAMPSTAVFIFLLLRFIALLSMGLNCNYPLLLLSSSVTVFVALPLCYLLLICLYEGGLRLWKHNIIMWQKKVIEINYFCNVFVGLKRLCPFTRTCNER